MDDMLRKPWPICYSVKRPTFSFAFPDTEWHNIAIVITIIITHQYIIIATVLDNVTSVVSRGLV